MRSPRTCRPGSDNVVPERASVFIIIIIVSRFFFKASIYRLLLIYIFTMKSSRQEKKNLWFDMLDYDLILYEKWILLPHKFLAMISWVNLNLKPPKCSDRARFPWAYWGEVSDSWGCTFGRNHWLLSLRWTQKSGDFFAICLLKLIPTLFLFYVFLFICPAVFAVS